MLYFAYGSNMDADQMKCRCPSAEFKCRAKLPDHRLAFTRKSSNRGCGVADVVPDEDKDVWGVVYDIDEQDVACLDRCEGYRPRRPKQCNAYVREECTVIEEGDPERPSKVWTYFANPLPDPPPPSDEYMQTIIRGARHWGLPKGYVQKLEGIDTIS